MSYFTKYYNELRYPIDTDAIRGLRNSQLGAIHAIAASHTLNKKKAGMIVMPTGSGKTSVLMMTPYITLAKKVLVVTPSVMVRGQIFEDFEHLITLKKTNVFVDTIAPPRLFELRNKYSESLHDYIESADVIVATPQCALSLSEDDIKSSFDLVLIDEAHHVPAPTWKKYS